MAPLVDGSERARGCGISLAIESQSFSDKSRDGDPKGLLTARARREKKKHGRRGVGLRWTLESALNRNLLLPWRGMRVPARA